MSEKTAIYQSDELIGYCDRVRLRTELADLEGIDKNFYVIDGFVSIDKPRVDDKGDE